MNIEETQRTLADCTVESEEMPTMECIVSETQRVVIAVIGMGDTGVKAVRSMRTFPLLCKTVEFVCAHADASALDGIGIPVIPLGEKPIDNFDTASWRGALTGVDMVVVVAGLDGHAENGVVSLVARTAKELGGMVVCLVVMPVATGNSIEAMRDVLNSLRRTVDCLMPVSVPFVKRAGEQMPFGGMQEKIIGSICNAVRSIAMMFADSGLICMGFTDIKSVLSQSCIGSASLGIASGKSRAQKAARHALDSLPLDMPLDGVKHAMYNIIAPGDVTAEEIQEILDTIAEDLREDCSQIFGLQLSPETEGAICVSIVVSAAAFDKEAR